MQTHTAKRGRATAATPSLAFNMGFGCTPLYQAKNRRGGEQNHWEGGVCEKRGGGVRMLALCIGSVIICCLDKKEVSRQMHREDLVCSRISQERQPRIH